AVVTQPGSAPVNTSVPVVSGQPVVGQVVSASSGSWSGSPAPSFGYQWQDCDSEVGRASCRGRVELSVDAVASGGVGSTDGVVVRGRTVSGVRSCGLAVSAVVTQPGSAPVNTSVPVVSGQPVVGQVVSASSGSWSGSPAPSFGYQWQDCDS